jgi:hypothetical protein
MYLSVFRCLAGKNTLLQLYNQFVYLYPSGATIFMGYHLPELEE